MLVLTRRVGESVVIGDGIRVTLLGVAGNKVRLGFEAPASVAVLRGEVFRREAAVRGAQGAAGGPAPPGDHGVPAAGLTGGP